MIFFNKLSHQNKRRITNRIKNYSPSVFKMSKVPHTLLRQQQKRELCLLNLHGTWNVCFFSCFVVYDWSLLKEQLKQERDRPRLGWGNNIGLNSYTWVSAGPEPAACRDTETFERVDREGVGSAMSKRIIINSGLGSIWELGIQIVL